MRDKNRIDPFLKEVGKIWKKSPDLRFGQIIWILQSEMNVDDTFYIEEDRWTEALIRVILKHK